jgi:predicted DNA binding protein
VIDARFRIRLPPNLYITDLSRSFPTTNFRLLTGVRTGDTASELGEAITDTPDAVVSAFREHEAIRGFEVLERTDGRLLTTYETTDVALYEFVEDTGFPPEFPIEVRDGHYEFDLTGTRGEFDRFRETLDEIDTPYELLSKVGTGQSERLLTGRQEELLTAGLREGYFEVPRECTLADLADGLGMDKSTASGIIRRAQACLIAWYLTGGQGEQRPPGRGRSS